MKKILMLPVYFIQLFTVAKSFKQNPIIGSRFLNLLGLHVFRVVLAYLIMNLRMRILSFRVPKKYRKEYFEKGYILIENLLEEKQFVKIKEELHSLEGEVRECIQGDTLTQRIHLDSDRLENMSQTKEFLYRKDLVNLWSFAAGKNHMPVSHLQVIKSHYANGGEDPQKNLHSDTFHPSMKYWFFLEDVTIDKAPFTYVEGSHKLTLKRLAWEYKHSINMETQKDKYMKSGSFRVYEDELESLGFGKPTAVCVPKNTLAIVNTFGFHRRGDAKEKSIRSELWGISRTNPFNPIIGLNLEIFHRLDDWLLIKLREYDDKQAMKKNRKSSWHVIKQRSPFTE